MNNKNQMKTLLFSLLVLFLASCSQPETIYLDEMDLSEMGSGWSYPKVNKSVTDNSLLINGEVYERGVGTHATSTFLIDLHGDATLFSALVGVDDASVVKGSIQFLLLGDGEVLWESPIMKVGMDPVSCAVSLKKINKLGLLVRDGGDGIDYDHANWVNAAISFSGSIPSPVSQPVEEEYILPPLAPESPRINGAPIIGVRPGSPLLHRIPATGKDPIEFSFDNLPLGIKFQKDS